jgi:hypothetical protein
VARIGPAAPAGTRQVTTDLGLGLALAAAAGAPVRLADAVLDRLAGHGEWSAHEVTAPVPDDANTVAFGVFLAGSGRIELRTAQLTIEN